MTQTSLPTNHHRLQELDALRGLAVSMVVLYHYTYTYDRTLRHEQLTFAWPLVYGQLGVNLFFIISGFVIFMTLERTRTVRDFAWARFSRLYPAYWVALLAAFSVGNLSGVEALQSSGYEFGVNATMLQNLFHVPNIDRVYWSLTAELTFYCLMAAVFYFRKLRSIEWIGAGWLALKLVFLLPFIPHNVAISEWLCLNYFNLFFAGILFYRIYKYRIEPESSTDDFGLPSRLPSFIRRPLFLQHLLIGICYLFEILRAYKNARPDMRYMHNNFGDRFLWMGLAVTAFFGLFYLLVYGKLGWIKNRLLLFLGSISYSLYLTHAKIGFVIMHTLMQAGMDAKVALLLTLILAVLIGTVLCYSIERPAQKVLKQLGGVRKKVVEIRA